MPSTRLLVSPRFVVVVYIVVVFVVVILVIVVVLFVVVVVSIFVVFIVFIIIVVVVVVVDTLFFQIPLDKTSEMTHSLLDVVTTIIERTLTISINNKVDATVSERVAEIARAVVATFSDKVSFMTYCVSIFIERLFIGSHISYRSCL